MPTFRTSVRIEYDAMAGGPGYNVWHCRAEDISGPSGPTAGVLHDLYEALAAEYPVGATIVGPEEYVDVESHEVVPEPDPWTVAGTGGGGFIPAQASIVTSWYSTVATRSGRGRTFFGPLCRNCVDGADGTPTGETMSDVRTATEAFVAANGDLVGSAWGIYSPTDGVIRDIVRARTRDRFASLRSRAD